MLKTIINWIQCIIMAIVCFGIIYGLVNTSVYIDKQKCLEKGEINNIQTEYIVGQGCFVLDNDFKYYYNDYMKAKAYKDNGCKKMLDISNQLKTQFPEMTNTPLFLIMLMMFWNQATSWNKDVVKEDA